MVFGSCLVVFGSFLVVFWWFLEVFGGVFDGFCVFVCFW